MKSCEYSKSQKCSALRTPTQSSCGFGKYRILSKDFLGGKIMSLELNLDPSSVNALNSFKGS